MEIKNVCISYPIYWWNMYLLNQRLCEWTEKELFYNLALKYCSISWVEIYDLTTLLARVKSSDKCEADRSDDLPNHYWIRPTLNPPPCSVSLHLLADPLSWSLSSILFKQQPNLKNHLPQRIKQVGRLVQRLGPAEAGPTLGALPEQRPRHHIATVRTATPPGWRSAATPSTPSAQLPPPTAVAASPAAASPASAAAWGPSWCGASGSARGDGTRAPRFAPSPSAWRCLQLRQVWQDVQHATWSWGEDQCLAYMLLLWKWRFLDSMRKSFILVVIKD